jgi:hypothetical protein
MRYRFPHNLRVKQRIATGPQQGKSRVASFGGIKV